MHLKSGQIRDDVGYKWLQTIRTAGDAVMPNVEEHRRGLIIAGSYFRPVAGDGPEFPLVPTCHVVAQPRCFRGRALPFAVDLASRTDATKLGRWAGPGYGSTRHQQWLITEGQGDGHAGLVDTE